MAGLKMFSIGPMCNPANTWSSWVNTSSNLKLAALGIRHIQLTQKISGKAFGSYRRLAKKKKTSYGEQAVMHCLPWKIWFVAASLKIQLVPTAQNKPKMCCMYFGSAQVYLQSGMMTLNGILGIQ